MNTFVINKEKIVGKIKPMNCVNNFPSMGDGYNQLFKDLNIKYSRLHDTRSMNSHLVDIPAIFPNFDADENDPNSYDFTFTDWFIARLHDLGTEAFYRLGVTIENFQGIKAYEIYPPKDFNKWARICEHVIAHYNEGWNNGFHYNLTYWEIWNEPENSNEIKNNQMWKGTWQQYMELYEISSNHLKKCFPYIKIGGYGSCGFYNILEEKSAEAANVCSRTEYFVKCAEEFLMYISSKEHKSPLDFFSFHSYSSVEKNILYARYARNLLDKYGFKNTETNLNEWNPAGIYIRGSLLDSSNVLSNMLALQNEPLDMLMYYDIRVISSYCGLFNPIDGSTFKTYYSFKAFGELLKYENQVEVKISGDGGVYAVAGYNGKEGAIVIANNSKEINWTILEGVKVKQVYMITEKKNLEPVGNKAPFDLFPFESCLVIFE